MGAGARVETDPLDLANNAHQGWHYLWIHQHPRAVEPLKKAIEMDPAFPVSQWYLGLAYEQTAHGRRDRAVSELRANNAGTAIDGCVALDNAYAAAGRTTEATALLKQLSAASEQRYVPPYPIAAIHAALGQKDEAFQWLERAFEGRDSWMTYLGWGFPDGSTASRPAVWGFAAADESEVVLVYEAANAHPISAGPRQRSILNFVSDQSAKVESAQRHCR